MILNEQGINTIKILRSLLSRKPAIKPLVYIYLVYLNYFSALEHAGIVWEIKEIYL